MQDDEKVLLDAEFSGKLPIYWMITTSILLAITVFGVFLIPLVWILGPIFIPRYIARLRCTLTDRSLRVERGLLTRVEKTVPLDKITDLGMVQGPIMRNFDIHALSIETAGQSGPGALVKMPGIIGAREFREAVIRQRDLITTAGKEATASVAASGSEGGSDRDVLIEIRDSLRRIEDRLPRS